MEDDNGSRKARSRGGGSVTKTITRGKITSYYDYTSKFEDLDDQLVEHENDVVGGSGTLNAKTTVEKWRQLMKPKATANGTTSSRNSKKTKKMKKYSKRGPKSITGKGHGIGGRQKLTDSSQQRIADCLPLGSKGNSLGSSNCQ